MLSLVWVWQRLCLLGFSLAVLILRGRNSTSIANNAMNNSYGWPWDFQNEKNVCRCCFRFSERQIACPIHFVFYHKIIFMFYFVHFSVFDIFMTHILLLEEDTKKIFLLYLNIDFSCYNIFFEKTKFVNLYI